jgi:primosomal protein N' (replication factor Y)
LLHGVTGSWKSQIYLSLIVSLLKSGKSVIFLIPEVTLAINFFNFFSKELIGFSDIFSWHTGSSAKSDNALLWQAVQGSRPALIIGVHLPIFLPIPNLGAIIIDEEHEESFAEAMAPHLNTKQVALIRAKISAIPILFGSATPCSTTYYQAKTDGWSFFSLTERFAATVASVELVELNYQRKIFWLSEKLISKITDKVLKKQQVILFLNRRGFATITTCKSCGLPFECRDCSVSLVLHKNDGEVLECHYCGLKKEPPFICICGSTSVKHKGLGTEQVCDVLAKKFPQFKILRADKSSIGKKDWSDKINQFAAGEFDILVGTKSVTKGYHFPNVTLVGILWADLDFSFPDYRSTERAIQQTLQVSGRSGRGLLAGEVLIQAFEPSVLGGYLKEESYLTFLEKELENRLEHRYPPFSKLIFIQIKDKSEEDAILKIEKLNAWIQNFFSSNQINSQILGPSTPLVFRQNKLFIQQLMIKIFNNSDLKKSLLFLAKNKSGLNFTFWLEV